MDLIGLLREVSEKTNAKSMVPGIREPCDQIMYVSGRLTTYLPRPFFNTLNSTLHVHTNNKIIILVFKIRQQKNSQLMIDTEVILFWASNWNVKRKSGSWWDVGICDSELASEPGISFNKFGFLLCLLFFSPLTYRIRRHVSQTSSAKQTTSHLQDLNL